MPTPRPFQAPVGISPIFNWENIGMRSSKAQAARDAAAGAAQLRRVAPKPTAPRMAGGLPSIFNRVRSSPVTVPVVGTALNAVDAALQLSEGRAPSQVATNLAAAELGGTLGAAVGTALLPGPGTVAGGILGSLGGDLLTRDLPRVNAKDINLNDPETLRILDMYRANPAYQARIEALEAMQRAQASVDALTGLDRNMRPFWQRTAASTGDQVVPPPTTGDGSVPPAPPQSRPAEEQHPPVTGKVPPTSTPSPEERTQENDLARFYAKTHMRGVEMARGGELQRRLWESGEMRGMTPEALMSWVEANPGVAYREAQRRGLLPEYETASFQ